MSRNRLVRSPTPLPVDQTDSSAVPVVGTTSLVVRSEWVGDRKPGRPGGSSLPLAILIGFSEKWDWL